MATKTQIYNVRQVKLKTIGEWRKENGLKRRDIEGTEMLIWTNDATYDDAQADIKISLYGVEKNKRIKVISEVSVS